MGWFGIQAHTLFVFWKPATSCTCAYSGAVAKNWCSYNKNDDTSQSSFAQWQSTALSKGTWKDATRCVMRCASTFIASWNTWWAVLHPHLVVTPGVVWKHSGCGIHNISRSALTQSAIYNVTWNNVTPVSEYREADRILRSVTDSWTVGAPQQSQWCFVSSQSVGRDSNRHRDWTRLRAWLSPAVDNTNVLRLVHTASTLCMCLVVPGMAWKRTTGAVEVGARKPHRGLPHPALTPYHSKAPCLRVMICK